MRKKLSLLSVIIKSKQKIQVIKLWKEPGNNWAIELGMTNPRPLEQSLTESKKVKSSKSFVWPNIIKPLSWCVSKKNSHFAVDVVQFVVEVSGRLFPVVVWRPACLGITLGCVWTRLGFTLGAAPLSIPLGGGTWCCQRHHSAIAVAPLRLGRNEPPATKSCWTRTTRTTRTTPPTPTWCCHYFANAVNPLQLGTD